MRLSKQSAPLVDSYDITVSKDEMKLIHEALTFLVEYHDKVVHKDQPEHTEIVEFHSVNLNDRKEQLYEDMTKADKVKQMKGSIDEIKGLVD